MTKTEQLEESRNIPPDIMRIVRQEAQFGCVLCGCPIVDYHHIEPYSIVKKHRVENLALLCPTHHRRAGNHEIPPSVILKAKANPFNKNRDYIAENEAFFIANYQDLEIKVGDLIFKRTPYLLTISGRPIIKIEPTENNFALLSAEFYQKDLLIAEIKENRWFAYRDQILWDVTYSPGHLKINRGSGDILFEFKVENKENTVCMKAKIEYKNVSIRATPTRMVIKRGKQKMSFIGTSCIDTIFGIVID